MKRAMGAIEKTSAAILLAGAFAMSAIGATGQGQFTVAVVVPVRVQLDVVEQPTELALTADDVARGYKDVAARYRIRHNDRSGYRLQLESVPGIARRVEVRGLGTDVVLGDRLVDVRRSGDPFEQELPLVFHVVLDKSSIPGAFELPVRVTAIPL